MLTIHESGKQQTIENIEPAGGDNEETYKVEDENIVDCPENIDDHEPSRVVMQYIDNTFHRWSEYDLKTGEMFLVLEKPEYRQLSAEEAKILLDQSVKWKEQVPVTDQGYTLEPDDPKLDVPPVPMPLIEPGQIVIEAVIGEDERKRVQDDYEIESYPWHTIGYILNEYENEANYRGTGFLVGPHTIFTNAHIIYKEEEGFVTRLEFSPAQFKDDVQIKRPYGTRVARPIGEDNKDDNYSVVQDFDYDYAVAYIDEPFEGINTFMPLEFNFNDEEEMVLISGYPGKAHEEDTFDQWYSENGIRDITDRRLNYYVDTSGGQSGSPVRIDRGTGERIVAFHAYGSSNYNGGPKLVDANKELIEEWMIYDKGYTLSVDETIEDPGIYTAILTVDADNAEKAVIEHEFTLQ